MVPPLAMVVVPPFCATQRLDENALLVRTSHRATVFTRVKTNAYRTGGFAEYSSSGGLFLFSRDEGVGVLCLLARCLAKISFPQTFLVPLLKVVLTRKSRNKMHLTLCRQSGALRITCCSCALPASLRAQCGCSSCRVSRQGHT